MSPRKLLSVTLGAPLNVSTPSALLSSWDVCAVNDLNGARKALHHQAYPVGLLLLNAPGDA